MASLPEGCKNSIGVVRLPIGTHDAVHLEPGLKPDSMNRK
jgi:hypothetical protein